MAQLCWHHYLFNTSCVRYDFDLVAELCWHHNLFKAKARIHAFGASCLCEQRTATLANKSDHFLLNFPTESEVKELKSNLILKFAWITTVQLDSHTLGWVFWLANSALVRPPNTPALQATAKIDHIRLQVLGWNRGVDWSHLGFRESINLKWMYLGIVWHIGNVSYSKRNSAF